jgi:hypothetical protein
VNNDTEIALCMLNSSKERLLSQPSQLKDRPHTSYNSQLSSVKEPHDRRESVNDTTIPANLTGPLVLRNRTLIMPSKADGSAFPDLWIAARLGDESQVRFFKVRLDTAAALCVIAEHVVADRFGFERIDASRWTIISDLVGNGVRTMGEITIQLGLRSGEEWLSVPFQVIPESCGGYRFDALLSRELVRKMNILVLGPDYQEEVN